MKVSLSEKSPYGNLTCTITNGMGLRKGVLYELLERTRDTGFERGLFHPHLCLGFCAGDKVSGIFTAQDLSYYDGSNGRPAYVVMDGIVYDVSKSEYWKGGMHENMHWAGEDLTAELPGAPHGREVLRHMPRAEKDRGH